MIALLAVAAVVMVVVVEVLESRSVERDLRRVEDEERDEA